jgi:hypothetical protein
LQICQDNYPFLRGIVNLKSDWFMLWYVNYVKMIARVPFLLTWYIFQVIVNGLSPIVSTYVFNQSKGHWLLSDVLDSTISICLKLNIEKHEF